MEHIPVVTSFVGVNAVARDIRRRKRSRYKLRNRPDVISYAKRHRRRTAQRFVDSAEIVEAHPKRDSGAMVLQLLAESVGQLGTAAHLHPRRQIEALHV